MEEETWLDTKVIPCPSCSEELTLTEHSPFYDCYYIYCNNCPKRVEVSFYDGNFDKISQILERDGEKNLETLMNTISLWLKPCSCGGKYQKDSYLRCHNCNEKITLKKGWDIWPKEWVLSKKEERREYEIACEEYEEKYVVTEDIWKKKL